MISERQTQTGPSEPIVTRSRTAQANGNSVEVNLTEIGRDVLGITPGDDLHVRVYGDRIEVIPDGDD